MTPKPFEPALDNPLTAEPTQEQVVCEELANPLELFTREFAQGTVATPASATHAAASAIDPIATISLHKPVSAEDFVLPRGAPASDAKPPFAWPSAQSVDLHRPVLADASVERSHSVRRALLGVGFVLMLAGGYLVGGSVRRTPTAAEPVVSPSAPAGIETPVRSEQTQTRQVEPVLSSSGVVSPSAPAGIETPVRSEQTQTRQVEPVLSSSGVASPSAPAGIETSVRSEQTQTRQVRPGLSSSSVRANITPPAEEVSYKTPLFSSHYTNIQKECKDAETGKDDAGAGDILGTCPAFHDYQATINWSAAHGCLFIQRLGPPRDQDDIALPAIACDRGAAITERMLEWRSANGQPFAVIVRHSDWDERDSAHPKHIGQRLVVRGLRGFESINTSVDTRKEPRANEIARARADDGYRQILGRKKSE
jgi:hypothetical protein